MLSRLAVLSLSLCLVPALAGAGWVSEWENTAIHNGERLEPERSTMRLADDKLRIEQTQLVSVFDYAKGKMTLINPTSGVFWSGSVDEYSEETTKSRNQALRKRMGKDAEIDDEMLKVDLDDLPQIKVERTDEAKTIAGYQTVKYVVLVNDELFQEIWMTEELNTGDDLNVDKFLDYQRRNSARMIGKSAKPFNALYRSKVYEEFLRKGFALQTITHHIAGGYEQRVLSIKQADVADSDFSLPGGYRKVKIADVFPAAPKE